MTAPHRASIGHLPRLLLLGAMVHGAAAATAQESAVHEVAGRDLLVHVRHWDEHDGLSHRAVNAIVKDRQGFLWLGTDAGLERFDGYVFTFHGRPQGLSMDRVTGLFLDAAGMIWVFATNPDGVIAHLDVVDPVSGRIRPFHEVFGGALQDALTGAQGIFIDPADTSLTILNAAVGKRLHYHPRQGIRMFPWPRAASGMHLLADGSILALERGAGGDDRIVAVDTGGRASPRPIPVHRGALAGMLNDADVLDGTAILCFFDAFPAALQELSAGGVATPLMEGAAISYAQVHPMVRFPKGHIWCGPTLRDEDGNVLLDLTGRWPGLTGARFGLRDGPDRLWIAGDFGLHQITVTAKRFVRKLYVASDHIPSGVRCRGLLVKGSTLYVNSERTGHWRLDLRTGDTLVHQDGLVCYAIAADRMGGIHRNEAFELIVDRGTRSTRIELPSFAWAILPDADGKGGLVAGEGFLHRYDVGEGASRPLPRALQQPLASALVTQLVPAGNGGLWVATNLGLLLVSSDGTLQARYWSGGEAPFKLTTDVIHHVRIDANGRLWVATGGAGLLVIEPGEGVVEQYDRGNGLPSNTVYASYAEQAGGLWLPTDRGLVRLEPATGRTAVFTTADGLAHDEFNRTSHAQAADGTLYFGGLNGVTVVPSGQHTVPSSRRPEPFAITRAVKFAGRDRTPVDLMPAWMEQGAFEVLPADGNLEIGFALLSYDDPGSITYEWQVEGVDAGWNAQSGPSLRLGRLPYGDQVLRIRAWSARSQQQAPELVLPIHVLRPVHLRWWAIASALAIIAGIVVFLFRMRLRRAKRDFAIRDRIAMDLHDEVGSTLSGINLTAAVARKRVTSDAAQASTLLDEIVESTGSTMDAMHDIVWAINARYDGLDHVVARMRHYAGKVCELQGVELRFAVDERSQRARLDMVQRRNTYLVFKEAVNNAMKYAQCRTLSIDIHMGHELEMTIADDGRGFHMAPGTDIGAPGHNGLRNMQRRADELNGTLTIVSAPGQGTTVRLAFRP